MKYLGMFVFCLLCVSGAFATHGHWIDHYKSALDIPCCGTYDCTAVPMRVLTMTAEHITIDIPSHQTVITIPRQSYHASEDEHDYWCAVKPDQPLTADNTRCIFIAVGS